MKTFVFLFVNILLVLTISAEEKVIINSTEKGMTSEELKKIYLGQKKTWSNGDKIILATLKNGNVNESFMLNKIGKKPAQFTMYWKKQVFTGQGIMPKSFEDEKAIIEFVANNKGAIGYISDSNVNNIPSNIKTAEIK